MSKKGKDFKFKTPIFNNKKMRILGAELVNAIRHVTFNKSNPRMSNDTPFPAYSDRGAGVGWRTINGKKVFIDSYSNRKKTGRLRRQDSGYKNSKAPVLTGDLWKDLTHSTNPRKNEFSVGWNSHAYKIDHLSNMGREITTKQNPVNPRAIAKVMPRINQMINKILVSGQQIITIGKKK